MFRNMAASLINHGQIRTTTQKAKELRRVVERLVTLGKKGDLSSRRLAFSRLRDKSAVHALFENWAKLYSTRPGGYTRILKLAQRRLGDAAEEAIIEFVDRPEETTGKKKAQASKVKVASKKAVAKKKATKKPTAEASESTGEEKAAAPKKKVAKKTAKKATAKKASASQKTATAKKTTKKKTAKKATKKS